MKTISVLLLSTLFLIHSSEVFAHIPESGKNVILPYKNASLSIDARVQDLINRMTIEEKAGQLLCLQGWKMYSKTGEEVSQSKLLEEAVDKQYIGMLWATLRADPWTRKTLRTGLNPRMSAEATNAIQRYAIEHSRLGIPLLFAEECAHGHMAIGTTVFPTSLGQSSTWNTSLIQKMATAIAAETRLQGAHIGYGPILDVAREPRWSRVEETYGEDPFLITGMGRAVVKGFQGDTINSGVNIVSTLKHFVAYGIPEGGHNSANAMIGERELFQHFLYPFQVAVETGALSIMTSYNSIDGIPCTSNHYLLTDIVRNTWGFDGFFVSDLGAVSGIASHRQAGSLPEAASLALNAGVDVDLGGAGYARLLDAIKQGLTDIATIDQAVKRVLRIKFEMGLFENPYVDPVKASEQIRSSEHKELARQVARESVVLLKNEDNILPLRNTWKNIAVIGPNADNIYNQLGDYTAPQEADNIITVLEGIKKAAGPDTKITYVKGCSIRDTTDTTINEAIEASKNADVSILVLGGSSARDFETAYEDTGAASVSGKKNTLSDMESGEGYDRSSLEVMGKQLELLQGVINTGTPVVVVLIEGRPLNLAGLEKKAGSILTAWYPGQEGGNAIADILFGKYNPAGRLSVSIPESAGQLPVYYNAPRKRRDYIDGSSGPLYCFGHGLSYTTFDYSNSKIAVHDKESNSSVEISFDVKNTGNLDGDEVPQLYIQDLVASVIMPEKQLKGFQRVHLKAGETKKIRFQLEMKELSLWDQDMKRVVEPGDFLISIGSSSEDIKLKEKFTIQDKVVFE
jgi:beta-glucosidase